MSINLAEMDTKPVRIPKLLPEVHDDVIRTTLAPYGKVLEMHAETWSRAYRYPVANGVRQVSMHMARHLLSHLNIAWNRVLLSYEGRPATCYGCRKSAIYIRCVLLVGKRVLRNEAQQGPHMRPLLTK